MYIVKKALKKPVKMYKGSSELKVSNWMMMLYINDEAVRRMFKGKLTVSDKTDVELTTFNSLGWTFSRKIGRAKLIIEDFYMCSPIQRLEHYMIYLKDIGSDSKKYNKDYIDDLEKRFDILTSKEKSKVLDTGGFDFFGD
jgi:hypothetical protein